MLPMFGALMLWGDGQFMGIYLANKPVGVKTDAPI
jgi:hypothetical protein